ncbi:LacI family DNA-binding transcriptional regulator [Acetanaerobacterium elongatum]|uniref:Transcriptional regulator, LacI family n=1 Tax=Acetanaerobacterium elongatum TaxID=258515 RepID=A0A1G9U7T3_9FIRM|nr:LacI family DNA-binding transcriptional regulator [Acetanaerobacterium elongatum]SDM55744.1 transcriptional regulator, LacI family [Acetanaerobacterium elongatum]
MVTIKDISAACGVSVATVSKALNGYNDVSKATKDLVCKAAEQMGYFPNSQARALKTNRTYNLGVLFVDDAQSGLTHDYFSQVLDSFKTEAERRGYDITFISHNIGNKSMSYLEHCLYRKVDGVVIACVDFSHPAVIELVNSDIPVVTIDHVFNNRTSIVSANRNGVRELIEYAYNMGHRKIAYVHGKKSAVTESRLGSFYKTMADLGLRVPSEYIQEGAFHEPPATGAATKRLLELPDRPTCILFPDDFAAIGGLNVIEEFGLSVPNDISVMGYDGIYLSQILKPRLTTFKQDTKRLGKEAAVQLAHLIEQPLTSLTERIVVYGKFLEGASVKNLNEK